MNAGRVEAFGRYAVYESLGTGGMARVDRAALTGNDGVQREVALKRMLPHVAENEEMIKAFAREARLLGHLRHANIAQTYEFGQVGDVYFIAMELVTGPTLHDVLKHCAQTTGPMPVPVALNILNQICDALDYAHNLRDETGQPLGIIHRDVSPSNVILNQAGVAKLIDFGVAKASAAGMQTMSGMIKGKFSYMAPEYLLGDIDARADLFAVGVIAHELLTNRPLFSAADDMATLRRVRTMEILPPSRVNPSVPAEIDDIVMTALSRDPDRRWQHATALRTALTTLTRRLGLVCMNQYVIEWIAQALAQPRRRGPTSADERDPSEPSVQIDVQPGSESPADPSAAGSQDFVIRMADPPGPPAVGPIGTPVRSFAPGSAGPHDDDDALDDAHSITDATELRRPDDSLSLGDATVLSPTGDGHSITDVPELHVERSPAPGPAALGRPAAETPPVGDPVMPRAPSMRFLPDEVVTLVEPVKARPAAQARSEGTPPGAPRSAIDNHNATLLDGGAALRARITGAGRPPRPLGSQPPHEPGPPIAIPRAPSQPIARPQGALLPQPLSSQPLPTQPLSSQPLPTQPLSSQPLPFPPRLATAPIANAVTRGRGGPLVAVILVLLAAGLAAGVVLLLFA